MLGATELLTGILEMSNAVFPARGSMILLVTGKLLIFLVTGTLALLMSLAPRPDTPTTPLRTVLNMLVKKKEKKERAG